VIITCVKTVHVTAGKWEVEAPQRNGLTGVLGLVLKSIAKHAAITARLDRPFRFTIKPLIAQYELTLQEGQECGGAYLKLLTHGKHTADLRHFHDKTLYTIMFGPDKCGNDHKVRYQVKLVFSWSLRFLYLLYFV
jgi:calnexin